MLRRFNRAQSEAAAGIRARRERDILRSGWDTPESSKFQLALLA